MGKFLSKLMIYTLLATLPVGGIFFCKHKEFIQKDLGSYILLEQNLTGYSQQPEEVDVDYKRLPKFSDKLEYHHVVNKDTVGRVNPFEQLYITEQDFEDKLAELEEEKSPNRAEEDEIWTNWDETEDWGSPNHPTSDISDPSGGLEIVTDFNDLFN